MSTGSNALLNFLAVAHLMSANKLILVGYLPSATCKAVRCADDEAAHRVPAHKTRELCAGACDLSLHRSVDYFQNQGRFSGTEAIQVAQLKLLTMATSHVDVCACPLN
jgi:hypothetical protein